MSMNISSFKQKTDKKDDRPQDSGLMVYVHYNDVSAVDEALRRLHKRMDTAQIMETFYDHTFFVKKSAKLRAARKKAEHLAKYTKQVFDY